MPTFRFDTVLKIARSVKVFLRIEGDVTRGPMSQRRQRQLAQRVGVAKQDAPEQDRSSKSKNDDIGGPGKTSRVARGREGNLSKGGFKATDLSRKRGLNDEGAPPDFIIIGAQKCGTTTLYQLLTGHPHVRRAVRKEVHYFDHNFDKGLDWYRSHFPPPELEDGRRTITGEASPYYIAHSLAPERVAKVVPQAKLIALLRDPVDRAYSHYQMAARRGSETLGFDEAIAAEEERLRIQRESTFASEGYYPSIPSARSYLARGIYVDQVRKWHAFFGRDQLLILKGEDYFGDAPGTLKVVLDFLGLPEWKPETSPEVNEGGYSENIEPETREKLHNYFEPHNQRLYEYLGVDFGW